MSLIKLQSITLDFPLYHVHNASWRSHLLSLMKAEAAQKNMLTSVRALDNISFELHPGDKLALIGGNGAGKTSLLKIISGIYKPTSGLLSLQGHVGCLLGRSFGMDDESTGYENMIMAGVVLGFSVQTVKARLSEIKAFSELGDFLNMPLRTYSLGMRARLAFSVVALLNTDLLLLDEGIGVADTAFLEKAKNYINTLDNRIVILASHSNELLRSFCNKGLLLKGGKIEAFGPIEEILRVYENQPIMECA